MNKKHILPLLVLAMLAANTAMSQIPVAWDKANNSYMSNPLQNSYTVEEISVNAVIRDQMTDVTVSQVIMNPNSRNMEVEIFFPLPNDAAIQNFMLMVDNQEIPGQLMKKEEARRIYEGIVRRQQDPALMEYAGYGLFKTSVFPVPAGQKRTISVRYSQLLPKKFDDVMFTYPFGTQKFSAQRLKKVRFNATIQTKEKLGNVFSPSDNVTVSRGSAHQATVSYEATNTLPSHDMRLHFGYTDAQVGVTLYSHRPTAREDGYFMLLASPAVEAANTTTNKNIVFVIDQSGSMAGSKIVQAKKALSFILENLKEGDLFNIVNFDHSVSVFKPELQRCNSTTQAEALAFVGRLQAGGGTNINDALTRGFSMFPDNKLPSYLIFLTDGEATSGETNEMRIAANAKSANKHEARLFAFGVGTGLNARLLDRLSSENSGLSEFVTNDAELEAKVSSFYAQISEPALSKVRVTMQGTDLDQTYPVNITDIFNGGQLVWTGRYRKPGQVKITITGIAAGKEKTYTYTARLTADTTDTDNAFAEKNWATKRIGHIMQQIDLNGQSQELVDALVSLSTRYGILTPYTAYLSREDVDFRNVTHLQGATKQELDKLKATSGREAHALRKVNNEMMYAPSSAGKHEEAYTYEWSVGDGVADSTRAALKPRNMMNLGSKTFYQRNGNYVESTVSEDEEKNAIRIKRYSTEYFELARQNSAEMNRYISRTEKIVFKSNGNVYLIE